MGIIFGRMVQIAVSSNGDYWQNGMKFETCQLA